MADVGMSPASPMLTPRKRLRECLGAALAAQLSGAAHVDVEADDPWVTGIAIDSRRVKHGDVFIACRGTATDGHRFVGDAISSGAVAVVVEEPVAVAGVPVIRVDDSRREAGTIAARFYDDPSRALACVGVTGTNGKTSVAVYVSSLLSGQGRRCAYGGTLGWGIDGRFCGGRLTTEDPVTLQRRLAELVAGGATHVAMEVSSHALAQQRVAGIAFDTAVFTNLTRDHLDYHGSMDAYAAAKRRLFEAEGLRAGVLNRDDPLGEQWLQAFAGRLELLSFGAHPAADLRWQGLEYGMDSIRGELATPWGRFPFELPLLGEFSVANFAAAIGVGALAGCDVSALIGAARELAPAPGRMQRVRVPGRPLVVVDYAHTPDALAKAIDAVRRHAGGRVVCVFGCGGDRDRGKRALMARTVESLSDMAWVTNDNPRSEVPERIAQDVLEGFTGRIPVHVELDRARAIRLAIASAAPGDLVLVAGKGHESYQEIGGHRVPHSDVAVVTDALSGANEDA